MTFRKTLILVGAGFLLAVGLLGTYVVKNPLQVTITVIDSAGRPVRDAVIKPDGLRSKGGASHFGWRQEASAKPLPVRTDGEGKAVVPYPPYVMEQVETGTITFEVDHPDFAWTDAERVVDPSPNSSASLLAKARFAWERLVLPGKFRIQPVVLNPGGMAMVSGFRDRQEEVLPEIFAEPHFRIGWVTNAPGVLFSKRYPIGMNHLRLVHFPAEGRTLFSEVSSFVAAPGITNRLHLPLKPGNRLEVKLSMDVPRPVTNGRVALWINEKKTVDPGPGAWRAWREVDTNGVCVFESLPPGEVGIIGICDGYISANGPVIPQRAGNVCRPQRLDLEADQNFELEMTPSAVCEVLVLDADQKPLPGATVSFWPNVIGGGIFAQSLFQSADFLRSTNAPRKRFHDFEAVTDTNGVAVIRSLPGFGMRQHFRAEHPEYDMPFDAISSQWRHQSVLLESGQTSSVSVIMEKRGATVARDVP